MYLVSERKKGKRKAPHLHNFSPPCPPVTWSISGKDYQVACNLKLRSRRLSPGSANPIVGCDLLTIILPVTPRAMQEMTLHQQPLEQRFLPLPQQINNDLQGVQLLVKSVLVREVIVHRCMVQLSS